MSPLLITTIFILLIHQQSTLVRTSSSKVSEAQDRKTRDLKSSFQTKPKLQGSKEADLSFDEAKLEVPRLMNDKFDVESFRVMRRLEGNSVEKRGIRSNVVYFLTCRVILKFLYDSFDRAQQVVERWGMSASRKDKLDRASRLFWEFYALSKAKLDTFKADLKTKYPRKSSIYKSRKLPKQGKFFPENLRQLIGRNSRDYASKLESATSFGELTEVLDEIFQLTQIDIAQSKGISDDDPPKNVLHVALKSTVKVAKGFTCGALLYGVYNMVSHIMKKYDPNNRMTDSAANLVNTTNQDLKDGNSNTMIIITILSILVVISILGFGSVLWRLRSKDAKAKFEQSEKSATSTTTGATTV